MRLKVAYRREEMWLEYPDDTSVNVAQALGCVKESRPDVYDRWCDKEGRLRSSLAVFVNREHVRYLNGLATGLDDGDEVYVVPMAAGGCGYGMTRE
jgi:molybdopterin converting factor small subunit